MVHGRMYDTAPDGRMPCLLLRKLHERAGYELGLVNDHMNLPCRRTAEEKVAGFPLGLRGHYARIGRTSVTLALSVCRRDITDHPGLTIETVGQLLTRLDCEAVAGRAWGGACSTATVWKTQPPGANPPAFPRKDRANMPSHHDLLLKIAGSLDCSVESLHGEDPPPAHLAGVEELLRLWHALERPEDRARLLAVAGTLAGHHRDA